MYLFLYVTTNSAASCLFYLVIFFFYLKNFAFMYSEQKILAGSCKKKQFEPEIATSSKYKCR